MASSRTYPYATGSSLYAIFASGPQDWDNVGGSYGTPGAQARSRYAVALAEQNAPSGRYVLAFPASLPAGDTAITLYAGSSPSASDPIVGQDGFWCAGSGVIAAPPSSSIPACVVVAGSTAGVVSVAGLPAGRSYVGQRLADLAAGEYRAIASQSYASGTYTFTLGVLPGELGPFGQAPSAGALLSLVP